MVLLPLAKVKAPPFLASESVKVLLETDRAVLREYSEPPMLAARLPEKAQP
jgi:hypothetical protein